MNIKWSVERLEPGTYNQNSFEHLHRYALAMELTKGKLVLDIACGEGYGSRLLAEQAMHVTGVDRDKLTIENAKKKYQTPRLSFFQGSIENIPCSSSSFDVVVCFETLEHTNNHAQVIEEIKRVLKKDGVLIISTPDKKYYSDERHYKNPFHLEELYEEDFEQLIKKHFTYTELLKQQFIIGTYIGSKKINNELKFYTGDFDKIYPLVSPKARFLLAIASDSKLNDHFPSIFIGESLLSKSISQLEEGFKNKITYRVGHFLLWPIKKLYTIFFKSKNN